MNTNLYQHVINGESAQLPLPDRALFQLTGEDRVRYLNGQITNDIAKLTLGHALYGAVLTGKGKIISDLFVAADATSLWIDVPLSLRATAQQRLEKFLIADDATLEDVTGSFRLIHFFGHTQPPGLSFANRRFGLPGFDLWVSSTDSSAINPAPVVRTDLAETLRIEAGLGKWGAELDENTLPQEALFERHGLSYEKGCYVGQETVARIRSIGHVNRTLAFLEITSEASPVLPTPLRADLAEAGKLTSLTYSPFLQKRVGLGLVSRKFNQIGQLLQWENGHARITAIPRPI